MDISSFINIFQNSRYSIPYHAAFPASIPRIQSTGRYSNVIRDVTLEECSDPLNCYLNSLVIPIPDICIPNTGVCFYDLTCYGININTIPTDYTYPTTFLFGIDGLGTTCVGEYTYLKTKGDLSLIVYNTNILLDFYLGQDENSFPTYLKFNNCSIHPFGVNVSLSENSKLSSLVEDGLKSFIETLICTKLVDTLTANVTSFFIKTLDPTLQNIISNGSPSLPPASIYNNSNLYIDWSESIFSITSNIKSALLTLPMFSKNSSNSFISCLMEDSSEDHSFESFMNTVGMGSTKLFNQASLPFVDSLVKLLTDGTGIFNIDLSSRNITLSLGGSTTLTLTEVSVQGLDSFQDISLISPSPYFNSTLQTLVKLEQLQVSLQFITRIGNVYEEIVDAALDVSGISILLELLLPINKMKLDDLYLDQLHDLNCLLSVSDAFQFTSMEVDLSVDSIAINQLSGSAGYDTIESGIIGFIDNLFLLITDGFESVVRDVIYALVQGPIREEINLKLATILEKSSQLCEPHRDAVSSNYLFWNDSRIVKIADTIINQVLGPTGLNKLITCGTVNQTGSVTIPLIQDSVYLRLDGLNTFYMLQLLSSESSPYVLSNAIGLGGCNDESICDSSQELVISVYTSKSVVAPQFYNLGLDNVLFAADGDSFTPTLSLSVSRLHLYLDLLLQIDLAVLSGLHPSQINVMGCFASAVDALAVPLLDVGVSLALLSTLGPWQLVIPSNATDRNVTHLVNTVFKLLTQGKRLDQHNADITALLENADTICENGGVIPDQTVDDSASSSAMPSYVVILLALGFTLLALLVVFIVYRVRKSRVTESELKTPLGKQEVAYVQTRSMFDLNTYYEYDDTLLGNQKLPFMLRWSLPVLVMVTIALFLFSNLQSDTVEVEIVLDVGPAQLKPPPLFGFGLANSVHDMWEAGVYPLSILIAVFSAAWPYVKLVLMFLAWTLPSRLLTVHKRDQLLRFLDMFGKWSCLDLYVMLLLMCAFNFTLTVSPQIVVHSLVVPSWGFYTFLLGTILSLLLGHTMTACHRHVIEAPLLMHITEESTIHLQDDKLVAQAQQKLEVHQKCYENLLSHHYSIHTSFLPDDILLKYNLPSHSVADGSNDAKSTNVSTVLVVAVSRLAQVILVFLVVFSTLLVLAGSFTNTFQFVFKGLTGLFLKDKSVVTYSMVSVGLLFPAAAGGYASPVALSWMQASYFTLTLAMPLGTLLMSLVLLLLPLKVQSMQRGMVLMEVCNAWSALDVFCLSVLATMLEIEQFAEFIVGDKCDGINVLLGEYFDSVLHGDDKCFDMVAKVLSVSNVAIIYIYHYSSSSIF